MHQQRIVLITGAAGGVGSVVVGRFLDNGDTVVATDTDADELCVSMSPHRTGLALASAKLFAQEGAHVFITDAGSGGVAERLLRLRQRRRSRSLVDLTDRPSST